MNHQILDKKNRKNSKTEVYKVQSTIINPTLKSYYFQIVSALYSTFYAGTILCINYLIQQQQPQQPQQQQQQQLQQLHQTIDIYTKEKIEKSNI